MSTRSVGESANLACLLEALAPKPGNVHRGADFEDLTFQDFAVSAAVIGQVFHHTENRSIGWLVRESIERIHTNVGRNTHLGTVLLLAPLAKATFRYQVRYHADIDHVLAQLTANDAHDVWAAIRLARPGGLGSVPEMDVADSPPKDLLVAMKLAEHRDLVAAQYANGFRTILDEVAPVLTEGIRNGWTMSDAIVYAHVTLMARYPDSLISRKVGAETAEQSRQWAERVLLAGRPGSPGYMSALAELDFWLRSDGNRRNPGTTADLIAAGLFVVLRTGQIPQPIR